MEGNEKEIEIDREKERERERGTIYRFSRRQRLGAAEVTSHRGYTRISQRDA